MIVVTGAAGIIGRALMARLEAEGIEAIGVRREAFDLSSGNSLVRFVGRRPEVIVHLAAAVPHSLHYPDSDSSAAITRAIDKVLFEAATYWGCRLIYASTCSLYDKSTSEVKFEDTAVMPRADSHYMRVKYEGGRLFGTLPSYSILRVSAPIGPGLPDTVVAKRFLNQAMAGQTIRVWGTGRREQNYIDVSDIADIFLRAGFSSATGIFNISADAPTTMLGLAETLVRVVNRGSFELSGAADPLEVEYARYSNARAYEQLGWKPRKLLEESIRSMYEACNENS